MLDFRVYDTTAARIAVTLTSADIGRVEAFDKETGKVYKAVAAGAGANCWVPYAEQFGWILFSLDDFREADSSGDVSNVAANGGILASDTTPIRRAGSAEEQEIAWATGNADPVVANKSVPADFDDTRDVTAYMQAVGGTTNAPSFTLESGWTGAALVSDTIAGTAVATEQTITATISASDIASGQKYVNVALTPGTHASDVFIMRSFALRYYRK